MRLLVRSPIRVPNWPPAAEGPGLPPTNLLTALVDVEETRSVVSPPAIRSFWSRSILSDCSVVEFKGCKGYLLYVSRFRSTLAHAAPQSMLIDCSIVIDFMGASRDTERRREIRDSNGCKVVAKWHPSHWSVVGCYRNESRSIDPIDQLYRCVPVIS